MGIVSVVLDGPVVRDRLVCKDKSLTKQGFVDECDINKIIKKASATGLVTHLQTKVAMYGDFTGLGDYHMAMCIVSAAEEMFNALPAEVRLRFNNDPAELMEFLNHPENREEGVKLGLLTAKPVEKDNKPISGEKPVESKPGEPAAAGSGGSGAAVPPKGA